MFERRQVRRSRDGGFEVRLPDGERRVIAETLTQLRAALEGDASADPTFKRLFPVAYAQDAAHEVEYQELVGDELVTKRIAQVDTVLSTIDADRITEDELFAWMGAVNDLRLVLGTRLDVSEDTDLDVDPSHPDAPVYGLYAYLGWLLELLVDAAAALIAARSASAAVLLAAALTGCGRGSWHRDACGPAKPSKQGSIPITLTSAGRTRRAIVYVPPSYDGSVEFPLVFDWHGYGANATEQLQAADLLPLADQKRFLVIAPEGEGRPTRFNLGTGITGSTDDVQLAADLIDRLAGDLCVDARRVYSVGISNGAGMSALLACRLPDRFAAVGMISLLLKPAPCAASSPPVLAMMGDADIVIPFQGGHVSCCGGWSIPPAGKTMDGWAAHLRCRGHDDDQVADHVDRRTWHGCADGRQVVYYVIHGGGHTWPGSGGDGLLGATNHEISASKIMWDFFSRYETAN